MRKWSLFANISYAKRKRKNKSNQIKVFQRVTHQFSSYNFFFFFLVLDVDDSLSFSIIALHIINCFTNIFAFQAIFFFILFFHSLEYVFVPNASHIECNRLFCVLSNVCIKLHKKKKKEIK